MKNLNNKTINVKNTMIKSMAILALVFGFNINGYANTPAQNDFNQALIALQHQWAETNYSNNEKTKKNAFIALQKKSTKLTTTHPKKAEAWIWRGIIQSSYAGFKGGLGAISLVDDAKESLEKALVIDKNALQGSAHTSLGILYLKVPGWPVSFGDDDESEKHLKTALEMNPTGIDVNYFLAQFYIEQDEYQKAKEHLITASTAPARPNRQNADEFRKIEINTLLTEVNKELKEG